LIEAFGPQLAAVSALDEWAEQHRPDRLPSDDAAGELIVATYARSSKTYRASFMLAGFGYGAQAAMLNRSLFEDMVVAHWVKLNPSRAPALYEQHRRRWLAEMQATYSKHELVVELRDWPSVTDEERQELADEFRYGPWTKRTLHDLVKAIEGEFTAENDRRLLWQTFDIVHRYNNLILHHSFVGLGLAATKTPGGTRYDVGPSDMHIAGALQSAFFSYGHITSLLHVGQELDEVNALWSDHISAFTRLRSS
jgi:hypothetical protein